VALLNTERVQVLSRTSSEVCQSLEVHSALRALGPWQMAARLQAPSTAMLSVRTLESQKPSTKTTHHITRRHSRAADLSPPIASAETGLHRVPPTAATPIVRSFTPFRIGAQQFAAPMAEREERHGEAKGVVEEVVAVLQRCPALFSAISKRLAAPEPCSTHSVWARQQALLLLAAGYLTGVPGLAVT
jgi:hypothetical protein